MLEYIVSFEKKFSTESKVNEYLIKVLRGIQRIRKILFPQQNNEKLDPFYILEKVEKYIKMRAYQMKKGGTGHGKKSPAFDEEFLSLEEWEDENAFEITNFNNII